jgi:hypothetical protein
VDKIGDATLTLPISRQSKCQATGGAGGVAGAVEEMPESIPWHRRAWMIKSQRVLELVDIDLASS